jgi:hypothetical protein
MRHWHPVLTMVCVDIKACDYSALVWTLVQTQSMHFAVRARVRGLVPLLQLQCRLLQLHRLSASSTAAVLWNLTVGCCSRTVHSSGAVALVLIPLHVTAGPGFRVHCGTPHQPCSACCCW